MIKAAQESRRARRASFIFACGSILVSLVVFANAAIDSKWTIQNRPGLGECSAELRASDGYSLELSTIGEQLWLGVGPAEKMDRRGYQSGSIRADSSRPLKLAFVDEQGPIRTILTRQLAGYIEQAARIQIVIGGRALEFQSGGIDSAIATVRACSTAHANGDGKMPDLKPPIFAKNWNWMEGTSGGCALRAAGKDLDTILMLNDQQQLILTAGRPDWTLPTGTGDISLKIDRQPSVKVEASTFQNLVLVRISDPALLDALKNGTTVTWELPSGPMTSDISGLAEAMKALSGCKSPS